MRPFSDKQLKFLKFPILMMIAHNDKSIEQANKLLPNVVTEKIKKAGHFLSVNQPEIVNKKILDFLKENDNLSIKK